MTKNYEKSLEESLPPAKHKRYEPWRQYALGAIERGHLVKEIVSKFTRVNGVEILDVGCGEGGISIAFSREGKNKVCALDIDCNCVKRSKIRANEENATIGFLIADGMKLPFKSDNFDLIICNDVIEHVAKPQQLVNEIYRNLKNGGFLYISTPNGIAPHSIIHDSHYGLFGVSLMSHRIGKHYVVKIRKVSEGYNIYGTFSYWLLKGILKRKFSVEECYKEYYLRKIKGLLQSLINRLPNANLRFIAPTLVFVCKKI